MKHIMLKKRRLFFLPLLASLFFLFVFFLVPVAWPQSTNYHTSYDNVISDVTNLANSHSDIAKMVPLSPKSVEGKTVMAIKISKDAGADKKKNRIIFTATQHAREWIAAEVAYNLIKHLLENYGKDAKITSYINNEEIWIVPVVNPDGYDYTRNGDRMWRKNRKDNGGSCSSVDAGWGVDPNRNFAASAWADSGGASTNCQDEDYKGPSPASEPEIQAVQNLMKQRSFQVNLDYHSFSQLILYPWGYTQNPSPDNKLVSTMANTMSQLMKAVHGTTYTPEQGYSLYKTTGDISDWVYETFKIPALTIELRPTEDDQNGFELPANQIIPTWEENKPAALYLLDYLNLKIQSPTQAQPQSAGSTMKVTVMGLWKDKTKENFVVKVGGQQAQVTNATRLPDTTASGVQNGYELTVQIPQLASGKYDLEVAVDDMTTIEKQAVVAGNGTSTQPTPPPVPAPSDATPSGVISPNPSVPVDTAPTTPVTSPTTPVANPSFPVLGDCNADNSCPTTPPANPAPGNTGGGGSSQCNIQINGQSFDCGSGMSGAGGSGFFSIFLLIGMLLQFLFGGFF